MLGSIIVFGFLLVMIALLFVVPRILQNKSEIQQNKNSVKQSKTLDQTKHQFHAEVLQNLFEKQSQIPLKPKITIKIEQDMLDELNNLKINIRKIFDQIGISNDLICILNEEIQYKLPYPKIFYSKQEGSVNAIVRSLKPKAHIDNFKFDQQLTNFVRVIQWDSLNESTIQSLVQ